MLSILGGAALEPVTAYLANPAHGEWARVASAKALAHIGTRHAELRAECVSRLSAQLEKFASQSETLNAFLVSPLLDLKAREALPIIGRAFAAGCVDEAVVGDYEAVEIELGLKTQRLRPPQPNSLTQFTEKLRAIAAGGQPSDASPGAASGPTRLPPYLSAEKPGRNDPCPCGSGKKHKKCCGK